MSYTTGFLQCCPWHNSGWAALSQGNVLWPEVESSMMRAIQDSDSMPSCSFCIALWFFFKLHPTWKLSTIFCMGHYMRVTLLPTTQFEALCSNVFADQLLSFSIWKSVPTWSMLLSLPAALLPMHCDSYFLIIWGGRGSWWFSQQLPVSLSRTRALFYSLF